jgi:hypothetical protein
VKGRREKREAAEQMPVGQEPAGRAARVEGS